jgi:hypothetical protein
VQKQMSIKIIFQQDTACCPTGILKILSGFFKGYSPQGFFPKMEVISLNRQMKLFFPRQYCSFNSISSKCTTHSAKKLFV